MSLRDHVAIDDLRPLVRLRRLGSRASLEVRLGADGVAISRVDVQFRAIHHVDDRVDAVINGGVTRCSICFALQVRVILCLDCDIVAGVLCDLHELAVAVHGQAPDLAASPRVALARLYIEPPRQRARSRPNGEHRVFAR